MNTTILEWIEMGYQVPDMQLNALVELSTKLNLSQDREITFNEFPPSIFIPKLFQIITNEQSQEHNILEAVRAAYNYIILSSEVAGMIPNVSEMFTILILRLHHHNFYNQSSVYPLLLENVIKLIDLINEELASDAETLNVLIECLDLCLSESTNPTSQMLTTILSNLENIIDNEKLHEDAEPIRLVISDINRILHEQFRCSNKDHVIKAAIRVLAKYLTSNALKNISKTPQNTICIELDSDIFFDSQLSMCVPDNIPYNHLSLTNPLSLYANSGNLLPFKLNIDSIYRFRESMFNVPPPPRRRRSARPPRRTTGRLLRPTTFTSLTVSAPVLFTKNFSLRDTVLQLHSSIPKTPNISEWLCQYKAIFRRQHPDHHYIYSDHSIALSSPRQTSPEQIILNDYQPVMFHEYSESGKSPPVPLLVDTQIIRGVIYQLTKSSDSIFGRSDERNFNMDDLVITASILFKSYPVCSLEGGIINAVATMLDLIFCKHYSINLLYELCYLIESIITSVVSSLPQLDKSRIKPRDLVYGYRQCLTSQSRGTSTNPTRMYKGSIRAVKFCFSICFDLSFEFGIRHKLIKLVPYSSTYYSQYLGIIHVPPETRDMLVTCLLTPMMSLVSIIRDYHLALYVVAQIDKLVYLASKDDIEGLIKSDGTKSTNFNISMSDFISHFIAMVDDLENSFHKICFYENLMYCLTIMNNLVLKCPVYFIWTLRSEEFKKSLIKLSTHYERGLSSEELLKVDPIPFDNVLEMNRDYRWLDWNIINIQQTIYIWSCHFLVEIELSGGGTINFHYDDFTHTIIRDGNILSELETHPYDGIAVTDRLFSVGRNPFCLGLDTSMRQVLKINNLPLKLAFNSFKMCIVYESSDEAFPCITFTSKLDSISCQLSSTNCSTKSSKEFLFASISYTVPPLSRTIAFPEMMSLCASVLSDRLAEVSLLEIPNSSTNELGSIVNLLNSPSEDMSYDRYRTSLIELGRLMRENLINTPIIVRSGLIPCLINFLSGSCEKSIRAFINVFANSEPGLEALKFLIRTVVNAFEITGKLRSGSFCPHLPKLPFINSISERWTVAIVNNTPGNTNYPDISRNQIIVNKMTTIVSIVKWIRYNLFTLWYRMDRRCYETHKIVRRNGHVDLEVGQYGFFYWMGTNAFTRPLICPSVFSLIRSTCDDYNGGFCFSRTSEYILNSNCVMFLVDLGASIIPKQFALRINCRNFTRAKRITQQMAFYAYVDSSWVKVDTNYSFDDIATPLSRRRVQEKSIHCKYDVVSTNPILINRYMKVFSTSPREKNPKKHRIISFSDFEIFGRVVDVCDSTQFGSSLFHNEKFIIEQYLAANYRKFYFNVMSSAEKEWLSRIFQNNSNENSQEMPLVGDYDGAGFTGNQVVLEKINLSEYLPCLLAPNNTTNYPESANNILNVPDFHIDLSGPPNEELNSHLLRKVTAKKKDELVGSRLPLKFYINFVGTDGRPFRIKINEKYDIDNDTRIQSYFDGLHYYRTHSICDYFHIYYSAVPPVTYPSRESAVGDLILDFMREFGSISIYRRHNISNLSLNSVTEDLAEVLLMDYTEEKRIERNNDEFSDFVMKRANILPRDALLQQTNSQVAVDSLELLWMLYDLVQTHCFGENMIKEYKRLFYSQHSENRVCHSLPSYVIVGAKSFPQWILIVSENFKMVLPYEVRFMLMQLCFMGSTRSIFNFQTCLGHATPSLHWPITTRSRLASVNMQLKQLVVSVDRNEVFFLDWAFDVLLRYGGSDESLNFVFASENGTGIGPTKEFYHLLSRHLQLVSTAMWLSDNNDGKYAYSHNGLFPAALPQKSPICRRASLFYYLMGLAIGRCLKDVLLLDIPFSMPFLRILSNPHKHSPIGTTDRPHNELLIDFLNDIAPGGSRLSVEEYWFAKNLRWCDFILVNNYYGRFLHSLRDIIYRKRQYKAAFGDDIDLSTYLLFEDETGMTTSLENLLIYFVSYLPPKFYSGSHYELVENGNNILLTLDNVELFTWHMLKFVMFDGIKTQMNFLFAGISSVINHRGLSLLDEDELKLTLCGDESFPWTKEYLTQHLSVSQNVVKESPLFVQLVDILVGFSAQEKRRFVKFVTGSSSLPHGGLGGLSPPLTVSEAISDGISSKIYPSSNTCIHLIKIPNCKSANELRELLLVSMDQEQFFFT